MLFNFLRNAAPFYIPTIGDKGSSLSTSWPTLDAFFFFPNIKPSLYGCEVVSYYGFNLYFPND